MVEVGNVGIGRCFAHEDALFVSMPFDWTKNKYKYLCIGVRNPFEYEVGNEYAFPQTLMVKEIEVRKVKTLLDNEEE